MIAEYSPFVGDRRAQKRFLLGCVTSFMQKNFLTWKSKHVSMVSNTKHVFHHALKPRYAISNGALPRKAHAIVFRAAPSVRTEESAVSFTYPRKQPPSNVLTDGLKWVRVGEEAGDQTLTR